MSSTSSNSASGLLSTLIPSFLVAVVLVVGFLLLRVTAKRIYQPRTYLSTLHQQYVLYASKHEQGQPLIERLVKRHRSLPQPDLVGFPISGHCQTNTS